MVPVQQGFFLTKITENIICDKIFCMNITAGKYKGHKIKAPDETITRPTLSKVRMSVFNTLQAMTEFYGSSFFDMFSGSGIMGLEALSRGFSKIVMVEQNKKVYSVIKSNIKFFEKDNDIKVLLGDSLKLTQKFNEKFDIIYIDPPYFSGVYEKSLEIASKICKNIIILEHVIEVDLTGYKILKQKKYGNKFITFIKI
jgi:16S rRNA (guanine(966)-N(2))-methyltransferase RsmD